MIKKIDAVQLLFLFYGFIASPLSRRKIAHLICRGKTLEDIYEIGCDVYCDGYAMKIIKREESEDANKN